MGERTSGTAKALFGVPGLDNILAQAKATASRYDFARQETELLQVMRGLLAR